MKRRMWGLRALLVVMSTVWVLGPFAADLREQEEGREDSDGWLESLAHRGPDHARLDPLVGQWKTSIKIWDGPAQAPDEFKGSASRRWVLGGRFLEERGDYSAEKRGEHPAEKRGEHPTEKRDEHPVEKRDPTDEDPVPYQGWGYIGYNALTALYEYIFMSNSTTGMFLDKGRFDADDNVLRLHGTDFDPETGAVVLSTTDIKIASPDRHSLTMYSMGADGRRWKQLEIVYTRKKVKQGTAEAK